MILNDTNGKLNNITHYILELYSSGLHMHNLRRSLFYNESEKISDICNISVYHYTKGEGTKIATLITGFTIYFHKN